MILCGIQQSEFEIGLELLKQDLLAHSGMFDGVVSLPGSKDLRFSKFLERRESLVQTTQFPLGAEIGNQAFLNRSIKDSLAFESFHVAPFQSCAVSEAKEVWRSHGEDLLEPLRRQVERADVLEGIILGLDSTRAFSGGIGTEMIPAFKDEFGNNSIVVFDAISKIPEDPASILNRGLCLSTFWREASLIAAMQSDLAMCSWFRPLRMEAHWTLNTFISHIRPFHSCSVLEWNASTSNQELSIGNEQTCFSSLTVALGPNSKRLDRSPSFAYRDGLPVIDSDFTASFWTGRSSEELLNRTCLAFRNACKSASSSIKQEFQAFGTETWDLIETQETLCQFRDSYK